MDTKSRPLWLSWRPRGRLSLFLGLYLACFSEVLTLVNATSWSKQLMRSRHVLSRMQIQNRALKVDKMKFNKPAIISFMGDTTSFKMTDQIDNCIEVLSRKKAVNLSLFSKHFKGMRRGQNAGSQRVKLNSSGRVFLLSRTTRRLQIWILIV